MLTQACLSLALLMAVPLWCQDDTTGTNGGDTTVDTTNDTRMLTPPPVSGQTYPTATGSEARSNYLRYGVSFQSAYSNNIVGGTNPLSDVTYSISPAIALDETSSTLHSTLSYSPGFTFYQRESDLDAADQNLSLNVTDRLSPHLTLSARDGLMKSSSAFNQPDFGSGGVSGGAQGPNLSVIPPVADMLTNSAYVGVSYQFAMNGMVGASGTFTNLHYANSADVAGLSDSNSQGGSLFYSLRVSRLHYVGVSYQYQRLVSPLTAGESETQTHTVFFFYTLYPTSTFSISFFGGPQYSDTLQPPIFLGLQLPSSRAWTPAAGASLSWQGRLTSLALSYQHVISGGGGLSEAVHVDSASASIRQQIARSFTASIGASYAQNDMIGSALFGGDANGHTLSGTVSLSKQFGEHIGFQLGYTRLHQDYGSVPALASTPDTNREFVSVSYQFSRPLGR
jgi:hypothetical protein